MVTLGREKPGTKVEFVPDALHTPHAHVKKVGRPRQDWVASTSKLFWSSYVRMPYDQIGAFEEFDPSKGIMSTWPKSKGNYGTNGQETVGKRPQAGAFKHR